MHKKTWGSRVLSSALHSTGHLLAGGGDQEVSELAQAVAGGEQGEAGGPDPGPHPAHSALPRPGLLAHGEMRCCSHSVSHSQAVWQTLYFFMAYSWSLLFCTLRSQYFRYSNKNILADRCFR